MTVSVRVDRVAVDPTGPPPTFTVITDRTLCEVQIATDPILFTGAAAARRAPRNFASLTPAVKGKRAVVTLDAASWALLRRFPHLAYRALASDGTRAKPLKPEATVGDLDHQKAPTIYVAPAGRAPVALTRKLSAKLPWLRVRGNRLEDEAGDPVVLRGVVRDGMATVERNGLDPTGVSRPISREVAGITQDEVREIVRRWGANVIRLPFNQEWALTRPDQVASLDRIIGWAADEGAYTVLALERLDLRRAWGTIGGAPSRIAPMPEENSVRVWTMLANRYRGEPAVLYEPYAFPHTALANDLDFVFDRPATDAGWVSQWHAWARRIATAIQRQNGRALLFVSGWDFGQQLKSFPIPIGGRGTLTAVYSVNADAAEFPNMPADVDRMLAAPALPKAAPVFVSRWSGGAGGLARGNALESALRTRHRFVNGAWPGVVGWTALSWGEDPSLVERGAGSRVEDGKTLRWRTFVMDGADHRPTAFGELVRGALRTAPFAASADFDAAQPFGQRSRFRVTASAARRGDFFVLRGHDLTRGTVAELTPQAGGAAVRVAGRAVGGFMLLIDELPATVPLGAGTVVAVRPDGVRSDPVGVNVLAGPPAAEMTLLPGATKASPFSIVLLANPWIESEVGATVLADDVHTARSAFNQTVGAVVEALFGAAERLLRDYSHEIKVHVRFATAPKAIANALCHEIAAPYMEPVYDRVRPFLAALPLSADVCFLVYKSTRRNLAAAWYTRDDPAAAALEFDLDGRKARHRRRATTLGTLSQPVPPTGAITPLHEFVHAFSEWDAGKVVDLYVDDLPTAEMVNRKARAVAGGAVPATFATLDATTFASAAVRDGPGLPYPPAAKTYHPERIVAAEPNLMDNYFFAMDSRATRLDKLTLRFLRDRLEWKLGR
jgi:hypothetical protein